MEDLIKFLRTSTSSAYNKVAADRIEELEKQCSFYARSDQFLVEEINELEAKLTKAEAYLQKISRHANRSCAAIAAHALAELEGGE